jgi:nucleoside-diphosphate-sugar epimerase
VDGLRGGNFPQVVFVEDNMDVFGIGLRGYLGSQLQYYVSIKNLPFNLIPYDRKKGGFTSGLDGNAKGTRLLLNLGTPNDHITRNIASSYLDQVDLWMESFNIAVNQVQPTYVIHLSTTHIINQNSSSTSDSYFLTHLECLKIIKKYCSSKKIFLQNVYVSNIFGTLKSDMMPRENLILNKAIVSLLTSRVIRLKNNGSAVRNFLWIGDFVESLIDLLYSNNASEEVVFASKESLEIALALKVLHKHLSKDLNFEDWCFFGNEYEEGINDVANVRNSEGDYMSFENSCKLQANIFFDRAD